MNPHSILGAFGLCALALIVTPVFAQSEPGNLMKETSVTRIQMPGVAMPARTQTMQVCVSAKKPDPREMTKQQKDCTISDYTKVGDTVSYHMACGQMQMSGDARFQLRADGGMHGTIHSDSNAGGQKMVMDMTIDGKRIGSCNYTPPKSAP